MDNVGFDRLTKGLATGQSRRSLLRGVFGGGAAVIVAKTEGVLAAPPSKVTICHFTSSAKNPYNIITVATSALPAHQSHGDFVYSNCCLDSECNDGDPCTINDRCDKGTCKSDPVNCDDGDACTIDSCVRGKCVHKPVNCDDGDACTIDSCVDGKCEHKPVDCDDNDPCTIDSCVDGQCVNKRIDCDDGDSCTTDSCVDGECVHTLIECPTGQACLEGVCFGCVGGACSGFTFGCEEDDACACVQTTETGIGFCVHDAFCNTLQVCDSSDDCPAGYACSVATCCDTPICAPGCHTPNSFASARSTDTGDGSTLLGGD